MSEVLPDPVHTTTLGSLYRADCMDVLPHLESDSVDTVFADPPFNLGKDYGPKVNDSRHDGDYLAWCRAWLDQCVRVLKPGGSLFVYNLPKWNVMLGAHLAESGMQFRHWVAVRLPLRPPIAGRMYPAHYSLLYYSRGKPRTFRRIRTPIETCRHCGREIRDYGGHRREIKDSGISLTDVWTDIAPVCHWKFKSPKRKANALSTKILDRVVEMSTVPGDTVLDPFGGSGTTYSVCERKGRRWIGIEIEYTDVIIERLQGNTLHDHKNLDYVET